MSRRRARVDATLGTHLRLSRISGWEEEYRFHPERRWRFDYAFPAFRLAIEIEGGIWIKGRHTRPSGFLGDIEKYNAAAMLGWSVLRFTPQQVNSGEALRTVESALLALLPSGSQLAH